MEFQGFQHIISPWLVGLILLALVFISWFSYRKHKSIPPLPKSALIGLRASALVLLFLLFMNPYFYSSQEREISPKIAVFLDNSESTGITKGAYEGLDSYYQLLNTLSFDGHEEANVEFYSLGSRTAPFHPDSLTASDPQTNLSEPIESILEMEEQVQAAVLITDGIITYGRNPAINAYNSAIPIYTIGIGDTADVKDISVANIITNQTGYTNTNHIIDAEISQSGFRGSSASVRLMNNGQVLEEQTVSFSADDQVEEVHFELELEEEGLKQYEIEVQELPNEWTDSNNSRAFTIDVLDSKVKILHVAFRIHPDVGMLRNIINTDKNNELTTLTWLENSTFIEDLPSNTNDFSLVIIHGNPPEGEVPIISELISDTPTLFLSLGTETVSPAYADRLQLIRNRTRQASPVRLHKQMDADEQPILELPEVNLTETPTLSAPLRTTLTEPQAELLYSIQYDGVNTESPALAILERGNLRRAQIIPWGWFKIAQSPQKELRDYNLELFTNIISWTSSDPDDRLLHISPSKQNFTTTEDIIINGILQNESGDPEEDAIIELELETPDGTTRTFNMESSGNGNYRLRLPKLPEGVYSFDATARKGNRDIDSYSGEFIISNSSTELTNTTRNDELLQTISNNSGGQFFSYDEVDDFWNVLEANNILDSQTEVIENYAFPVRSIFWFVVVLMLLGTEWLLRKYYSLP